MERQFKVGDKIKIIRSEFRDYNKYINKIGIIVEIADAGVNVEIESEKTPWFFTEIELLDNYINLNLSSMDLYRAFTKHLTYFNRTEK